MVSASSVPVVSYMPHGVPIAADVPDVMSSYTYALYPFLSPRALPLLMNTDGAFRVRRVGEWLGETKGESIEKTGGLAGGKGQILSIERYVCCSSCFRSSEYAVLSDSLWICATYYLRHTRHKKAVEG